MAVVVLSLAAFGDANAIEFDGVIDPKFLVTRVDSVNLVSPDMTFLTPGWGSHTPYDTFHFTDVPHWPASIVVHGAGGPFPFHQTIVGPKLDTWYSLGMGSQTPMLLFSSHYGVEEPRPTVIPLQRLTVSPSVVTGQMTARLQPVGTGIPMVEIHDAAGNVVRSLDCTAGTDGIATATWNREDDRGRLVPEGVYFCRYAAADVIAVRKVLVAH